MFYEQDDFLDAPATTFRAIAEFAYNHGAQHPDQAWFLHDWNVWVQNPHYTGPAVPHPEDDHDRDVADYGPTADLDLDDLIPWF